MQAKSVSKSKRLGYATVQNTMKTFDLVRNDKLSIGQKIDANMLQSLGIPVGDTFPEMGTLRHLEFVDSQDRITETFSKLAHATGEEYRTLLRDAIEHAYGDIIQRLDNPAKATRQQVVEILKSRRYELPKQHGKMAGLFIGLCRLAQMGQEDYDTSHGSEGEQEDSPEPLDEVPVSNVSEANTELTMLEPTEPSKLNGLAHVHSEYPLIDKLEKQVGILQLLLQMRKSPEWAKREHEWWEDNFRSNVNSLLKLVPEKEISE